MTQKQTEPTDETLEAAGEEQLATPAPTDLSEEMRILEAVLFASAEVLTAAKLKTILPGQPDGRKIRSLVNAVNAQLQKERHPFEIVELGGGYQFRTIAYYHPWVRQLFKEKASKRLSIQALECLAIVAYKQPLSKAEIESVRGVLSDGAVKTLLEKRLVTITGRSDKAGRPLLYGTTPEFLRYFGINKLADLPSIQEFEALAREKMEELTEQELRMIEEAGAAAPPPAEAAQAESPAEGEAVPAAPAAEGDDTFGREEIASAEDAPAEEAVADSAPGEAPDGQASAERPDSQG
jgi:segregation and condensation protein B